MDDDVICDPKALYELLIAIESKKNIGFVCSKVIGIDGSPMNTPIVNMESRSPILNSATLSFNFIYKFLSNNKLPRILPCQIFH